MSAKIEKRSFEKLGKCCIALSHATCLGIGLSLICGDVLALPFTVNAKPADMGTGYNSTNVNIAKGSVVTIKPSGGTWCWADTNRLYACGNISGTTHYRGTTFCSAGLIGTLVGKIGVNGQCFVINSPDQISNITSFVGEGGTLYLGMNDASGNFTDNSGSITVEIIAQPAAPAAQPVPAPAAQPAAPAASGKGRSGARR